MTAAKKRDTKPETKPATQPQPPMPPVAQTQKPEPVSKQQQTIAKRKQAWTEKGVSLKDLIERQDGKFILLQPTPEWPVIRVAPTGGLELPQVRSFAKALDACVDGLDVYQKQQARDANKKAETTKPTPQPQAQTATAKETPAVRKARESEQLEKQLAHA